MTDPTNTNATPEGVAPGEHLRRNDDKDTRIEHSVGSDEPTVTECSEELTARDRSGTDSTDRIAEIRARLAHSNGGWQRVVEFQHHAPHDIAWLLGEVERLRDDLTVEREHSSFMAKCLHNRNAELKRMRDERDAARRWSTTWRNLVWVREAMWRDLEGAPRSPHTPYEVTRHLTRKEWRLTSRRWARRAGAYSLWYYLRGERLGPRP